MSVPKMAVDLPASNSTVQRDFVVAGWAADRVWAYPTNPSTGSGQVAQPIFVGKAPVGLTRKDVGAAFGSQFTQAGYHLNGSLPAGTYQLVVFAFSSVAKDFNTTIVVPITVK